MSRPQVGIDRLPTRRIESDQSRESMNCKSCRKRKIKCNRLRPICEACRIFQCPCIYDATPKKRGPKPDVLEALLKRVDGLERRLQDEKKPDRQNQEDGIKTEEQPADFNNIQGHLGDRSAVESDVFTIEREKSRPSGTSDTLIDIYFGHVHGKPYRILDEASVREEQRTNQLSPALQFAIYAISARYASNPGGHQAAIKLSEDYAHRSRSALDVDDPSIEGLQTCLLLCFAFLGFGKGRKAYMLLSHAVAQVFALDLLRELPPCATSSPADQEIRRRLFWTCYLMDRFTACGSKRPSLISDESISLRLPSWTPHPTAAPVEGPMFATGPNIPFTTDNRKRGQDPTGLLIDVVRILGITNRYLAAGGVKGDRMFPWHHESQFSKILQELELWAANTHNTFTSLESLFKHPESTILVLSKLVYHLCHCLIMRTFLPIDLAELVPSGQHQSYQISSTNQCFLHANAIAELVDYGRSVANIEWPAFVGYCIGTAGTVHIHGVHYKGQDGGAFAPSSDFLAREMHQLGWLRLTWASVQTQREFLQAIYAAHAELVRSLTNNPIRYSPVFLLEDFFDRYPGQTFDGSHMPFSDAVIETEHETQAVYERENTSRFRNSSAESSLTSSTAPSLLFHQLQTFARVPQDQQHHSTEPSIPGTGASNTLEVPLDGPSTPLPHLPQLGADFSTFPFSPNFSFSPLPNIPDPTFNNTGMQSRLSAAPAPTYATFPFDQQANAQPGTVSTGSAQTPGAHSQGGVSNPTTSEGEKDPFLSLLEHITENEYSQGGPSDLGFFLNPGFGAGDEEDLTGGTSGIQ